MNRPCPRRSRRRAIGIDRGLWLGLALLIVGIIWLVVSAVGAFLGWLGSTRI